MSEPFAEQAPTDERADAVDEVTDVGQVDRTVGPAPARAATGHEDVDAALASLEGVEQRPLEEQVAAFETVHETLRTLLDGAADASAPR